MAKKKKKGNATINEIKHYPIVDILEDIKVDGRLFKAGTRYHLTDKIIQSLPKKAYKHI